MNFRKKTIVFFFVTVIVLVSLLSIVYYNFQKVKSTSKLVEHTQEVLRKNDNILLDILNIEGFILTGNNDFLKPFNIVINNINDDLVKMTLLTKDNSDQQLRIDTLNEVINNKLVFTKTAIDIRQNKGLNEAVKLITEGKGLVFTDKIRSIIHDINLEEVQLLKQRKNENEKSFKNFELIFTFLLVCSLIIIVIIIIYLKKEKKKNEIAGKEKQNSQYSRSLIEASLDPLVTISADGKITDVNEASVKVTGVTREKLIGTDFSNYFIEPEKAQAGYHKAFEKGFVIDYPLTIKHKNGKLTDVLYNASVYKDDNGNILGVFAAARDVTEQKRAAELSVKNKKLAFQNEEKEKRAAELIIANKELAFQNEEKEKRAAELIIANEELAFQNEEKEKRAAELIIANEELAFQNEEKEKRAAELIIANKELTYQNREKEKRADELIMANKELAFQNNEKEKRAAELIIANKELAFQNEEKEKRAAELIIANKELTYQNREKEKRADESIMANKELAFQNGEKEKRAAELIIANKELAFQNNEKEKRAAELIIANEELTFQNREKEKRAAELIIANKELAFQNEEKEKRAAELIIANKELAFQNDEKEKRAAELIIANKELAFQNNEKEKRAAELSIANKELVFQNELKEKRAAEKEKRAAELIIANQELAFQNEEKEKRAAELIIANKKLVIQNDLKEKRAAELIIANKELAFQNDEKEKRAAELIIANKELAFQNEEKEKRAAELIIANKELAFQNDEKEKRAAELIIANKELAFQNELKEKRADELFITNNELKKAEDDIRSLNEESEQMVIERTMQLQSANKELEAFTYSVSHDLRAPLRAINGYANILQEDYASVIDNDGNNSLNSILKNSKKMGELIDDLLAFSRLGRKVVPTSEINMTILVKSIKDEELIENKNKIEFVLPELLPALGQQVLIKQVWINLISNAIKYSDHNPIIKIEVGSYYKDNLVVYFIKDNGVGFDMQYYDKLFGVFQRLHSQEEFEGTGIGLAIVQKIIHRHNGTVWAESKINEGSCFYFTLPVINF